MYKEDYPDVPKTVSTSLFAKDPDWKPTISEACRKADLESRKNRKVTEKQLQITRENGMKKQNLFAYTIKMEIYLVNMNL